MKKTNKSTVGTSFYGSTITTTVNKLISVVGEPTSEQNDGKNKCNFDFSLELEDGDVFTIYDWKEYRKIGMDEEIEFHIGSHTVETSRKALSELIKAIK